jgi:TolA-binding protein
MLAKFEEPLLLIEMRQVMQFDQDVTETERNLRKMLGEAPSRFFQMLYGLESQWHEAQGYMDRIRELEKENRSLKKTIDSMKEKIQEEKPESVVGPDEGTQKCIELVELFLKGKAHADG